jgi:hypothetical protein
MNNLIYRIEDAKKWLNENNIPFEVKNLLGYDDDEKRFCEYYWDELRVYVLDNDKWYDTQKLLLSNINFLFRTCTRNGEPIYYFYLSEMTNIVEKIKRF